MLTWPSQTLSSDVKSTPSVQRENSKLYAQYEYGLTIPAYWPIPFKPPSLPVIPNKPRRLANLPYTVKNGRLRVEKVLYGESYGTGQCVALAQAWGFHISGSARLWPYNARQAGYVVDTIPQDGAAIITTESSYGTNTGHVLIQNGDRDGDWLPVIEQNYVRLTVTTGWLNVHSPTIVAFIHPK